jgi:hypothetical protein
MFYGSEKLRRHFDVVSLSFIFLDPDQPDTWCRQTSGMKKSMCSMFIYGLCVMVALYEIGLLIL